MILINIIMIKKNANQRKHCLFRDNELAIVKEAIDKAAAVARTKLSFSYFIRKSAIQNAEAITGKRIAP
jgi:hypothetical protein